MDRFQAGKRTKSWKVSVGIFPVQMFPMHVTHLFPNLFADPPLFRKQTSNFIESVVVYLAGDVSADESGDTACSGRQHERCTVKKSAVLDPDFGQGVFSA